MFGFGSVWFYGIYMITLWFTSRFSVRVSEFRISSGEFISKICGSPVSLGFRFVSIRFFCSVRGFMSDHSTVNWPTNQFKNISVRRSANRTEPNRGPNRKPSKKNEPLTSLVSCSHDYHADPKNTIIQVCTKARSSYILTKVVWKCHKIIHPI